MLPLSSPHVFQAIFVKTEVCSDAEEEEDPVAITFPGIKTEPKVSSVSLSVLIEFQK
jgi:hypothetical protein